MTSAPTAVQVTGGDPTLRNRDELVAIVRRIRERGLLPTLMTNGTVVAPSGAVDVDLLIDGEQVVALVQPGSSALGSDLAVSLEARHQRSCLVGGLIQ